jgi:hypothetical protein
MMTESDARAKLSAALSSLQTQRVSRFRGGNIRIKNNPGFLTKITKGAFNNIITIEISNINNTLFLPSLHIYLDSIIRIYQDPHTTDIPYEKISELCAGVGSVGATSVAAAAAAGPVADKEEVIELMTEIVPVAATSAPVVFGFEAEQPKEEIDLFDLLQDDDDGEDDGEDGDVSEGEVVGPDAVAAGEERDCGADVLRGSAGGGVGTGGRVRDGRRDLWERRGEAPLWGVSGRHGGEDVEWGGSSVGGGREVFAVCGADGGCGGCGARGDGAVGGVADAEEVDSACGGAGGLSGAGAEGSAAAGKLFEVDL